MEFNEKLNELSERISNLKDSIATEEATKTSMIMPFFQMLGYDGFNPLEFVPEFTADVGIKKGEKVDYAILIDGAPLILIECKSCNTKLDKHGSQLFRYFGTTEAKFGILTNGIIYKCYTDLETPNKLDSVPFLTVDITNLKDRDIMEIKKFTKEVIDVDSIVNSAEALKYNRLIKEWFESEINSPSPDFVRYVLNGIYDGVKNQNVIEKFTPIVKRAIQQYISDSMNSKIKIALNNEAEEDSKIEEREQELSHEDKINTTIGELEAYAIVKAILRQVVDSDRIAYRDTESYFGILLDDNNRKWICRVYLMASVKYITVADENKKPVRHDIDTIDDIYKHSDEIIASCKRYLAQEK